jgi:cobalt/nickel transport system permease protein
MHLSEGFLSAPVLATGGLLAAGGVAAGLRRMQDDEIPRVAVLSACFFVVSLIRVPAGWTSVHLILNGLTGLLLGWSAFPAILIGLLLQAVFFAFGGLTVLGVNTIIMAVPAVLCHRLLRGLVARAQARSAVFSLGFLAGAGAVAASAVLAAVFLASSHRAFGPAAAALWVAHAPVFVIDGLVTGSVLIFLKQVRPTLLAVPAKET